jgi:hypothetical protein
MADDDFVTAVGPDGKKRRVPSHYLDNPAFGFKLPPSARAQEPAEPGELELVQEPVLADQLEQVEEPATPATPKNTRSGAAGETKEARS